jgi:hypothetical protein
MSRGADSARRAVFGGVDPAGSHVPAPNQVLFGPCNAPLTVKNPAEAPVRTASYTVPESSAIGTGEALYAPAS